MSFQVNNQPPTSLITIYLQAKHPAVFAPAVKQVNSDFFKSSTKQSFWQKHWGKMVAGIATICCGTVLIHRFMRGNMTRELVIHRIREAEAEITRLEESLESTKIQIRKKQIPSNDTTLFYLVGEKKPIEAFDREIGIATDMANSLRTKLKTFFRKVLRDPETKELRKLRVRMDRGFDDIIKTSTTEAENLDLANYIKIRSMLHDAIVAKHIDRGTEKFRAIYGSELNDVIERFRAIAKKNKPMNKIYGEFAKEVEYFTSCKGEPLINLSGKKLLSKTGHAYTLASLEDIANIGPANMWHCWDVVKQNKPRMLREAKEAFIKFEAQEMPNLLKQTADYKALQKANAKLAKLQAQRGKLFS
jgi:hypothetical protein